MQSNENEKLKLVLFTSKFSRIFLMNIVVATFQNGSELDLVHLNTSNVSHYEASVEGTRFLLPKKLNLTIIKRKSILIFFFFYISLSLSPPLFLP